MTVTIKKRSPVTWTGHCDWWNPKLYTHQRIRKELRYILQSTGRHTATRLRLCNSLLMTNILALHIPPYIVDQHGNILLMWNRLVSSDEDTVAVTTPHLNIFSLPSYLIRQRLKHRSTLAREMMFIALLQLGRTRDRLIISGGVLYMQESLILVIGILPTNSQ